MIYLIAYRIEGKVGLALSNGAFNGGEDLEQTKSLLPDYNRYHVAGYTWSMSSIIYWMQFMPCVLAFKDMKEIEGALLDKKVLHSASIAGRGVYTLLKPDYVHTIAFDPKLIDQGIETAKPFYEK